jgi:hypothetical protein
MSDQPIARRPLLSIFGDEGSGSAELVESER